MRTAFVVTLMLVGACGDDEGMEIIVDPDNIAPVLTDPGNLVLATIDEDASTPAGDTVADILNGPADSEDPITDEDADDPEGIAVVAVDNTNGAWEYDPDGEGTASFIAFGAVSGTSAVVLDPTALIRFVPDENFNGSGGAITFRAWDQSAGLSSGNRANIDSVGTGDPTPFSLNTAMTTITVTAVNDVPRNTGSAPPAITASEGVAADVDLSNITVTDVDLDDSGAPPNDLEVTLTATAGGTLSATAGSTGVTFAGNDSSMLTITGSLMEVNSFFDNLGGADLQFTIQPEVTNDSIRIAASDGGLTGNGGEGTGTLAVVGVNTSTSGTPGTLTFVDFYRNEEGGFDRLSQTTSIAISPTDDHVYVGARKGQAISVFLRNPITSTLSFIETITSSDGLVFPGGLNAIAISPDGKHVYTAAPDMGVVQQLTRDPATGRLTVGAAYQEGVGSLDTLQGASGVVVSPDGNFVYVAAFWDNAVSVFSRNAMTGALTIIPEATQIDNTGGVDGLERAGSLALSPGDGSSLYVAASFEHKVAVFARNTSNGSLSFLEVHEDGSDGVDGLAGVQNLTVSPDGKHLYAVGTTDDAIAVFSRASDGRLTFESVVKDGQGDVMDLDEAFLVAVSPDGQQVYATASVDDALLTFSRNPDTGALTFVESHIDDVPPVNGLDGARGLAVSADGKSVYATGQGTEEDAVVAFHRETGS